MISLGQPLEDCSVGELPAGRVRAVAAAEGNLPDGAAARHQGEAGVAVTIPRTGQCRASESAFSFPDLAFSPLAKHYTIQQHSMYVPGHPYDEFGRLCPQLKVLADAFEGGEERRIGAGEAGRAAPHLALLVVTHHKEEVGHPGQPAVVVPAAVYVARGPGHVHTAAARERSVRQTCGAPDLAAGDDAVEGGGGAADQLGVGRRLPPARSQRLLEVKVDSVQLVLQGEAELLFHPTGLGRPIR